MVVRSASHLLLHFSIISPHQLLKQNTFWYVEKKKQIATPQMPALETLQAEQKFSLVVNTLVEISASYIREPGCDSQLNLPASAASGTVMAHVVGFLTPTTW